MNKITLHDLKKQVNILVGDLSEVSRFEAEALLTNALSTVDILPYQSAMAQELMAVTEIIDVVPDCYRHFRPIVSDGVLFFLKHFSTDRFISLIVDQVLLKEGCSSEQRLIEMVKKIPTLHKLGQVIARRKEIDKRFRQWLITLENGIQGTQCQPLCQKIERGLAHKTEERELKISSTILSEASVGVVIPFTWKDSDGGGLKQGVFKLLKPHVTQYLHEEFRLLDELARFYDCHRQRYSLKDFRFIETFKDIKEALDKEINLKGEQENLKKAASFYEGDEDIKIPALFPLCTDEFTAMEFLEGQKFSDTLLDESEKKRCARTIFRALIVSPLFSYEQSTLFHGDPHGGNIFVQTDRNEKNITVLLLDWSQAGWLSLEQRYGILQLLIGVIKNDEDHLYRTLEDLSEDNFNELPGRGKKVRDMIHDAVTGDENSDHQYIDKVFTLVDSAAFGGVRFPRDLLLFRKAIFTVKGLLDELDVYFNMDSYMMEALGSLLIVEMPKRGINMMFPLLDRSNHYKTMLTNLDLISLWSHLFLLMLQKGLIVQSELTELNLEMILKTFFCYRPLS